MKTTEATRDFVSIGQLAAHIQQSVRSIERAAHELAIIPAMRLNHIAHFDGRQVEKLVAHFRKPEHLVDDRQHETT